VLGHGESEAGAGYLLLEGVDGNVHYFAHVFETERAHARGDLKAGYFVELSAGAAEPGGRAPLRVRSFCEASQWLRDPAALSRWESGYLRAGGTIAPGTDKGWLGQFAAAREALRSVSRDRER
jgi:8-oxo-dGTP pyrophosphatase MutT (NUDIX family)